MNYTKQVNKLNPNDMPMIDTDYYHFMADGGYLDNRIACKVAYLADRFGFVKGKDKIDSDCITLLNHIGTQYWSNELRPAIEARILLERQANNL